VRHNRPPEYGIWVPRWGRTREGLILPSSMADAAPPLDAEEVPVPKELRPPPAAIALFDPSRESDQVWIYASEEELDLPVSTFDDLCAVIEQMNFSGAMRWIAWVTARVSAVRGNSQAQLALARHLCLDDELYERIAVFVRAHKNARVFAEQNCLIFERLLVEFAADGPVNSELTDFGRQVAFRTLLGCSAIAGGSEKAPQKTPDPREWMAFFTQNGDYNTQRMPMAELVRAQELFARLAGKPELQDPNWSIDAWCRDDYGFTVEEQMALGFALAAMARIFGDDPEDDFKIRTAAENFDDLLLKFNLLDRRREALELVSATREELRREFADHGDEPERLAWDAVPFFRHPLVRLADDSLILSSPRAILSWLGEGFHFRLQEAAQRRGRKTSHAYTAFAGRLLETYALELMESVHPGVRPAGAGRVLPEQPYGRGGGSKTSDIAVDLGPDLILFEISHSRLRADTLILGNEEMLKADLRTRVVVKVEQLDGCITALERGDAVLTDVVISQVKRIWPVVVTASNLTQTGPLWEYIDAETAGLLQQAKVQPLTLMDGEDYEALCGLIEQGHSLVALLEAKTAPEYRRRELAAWSQGDPNAPRIDEVATMVSDAWGRTSDRVIASADFTKGVQQVDSDSVRPNRALWLLLSLEEASEQLRSVRDSLALRASSASGARRRKRYRV
jgi:hypothetical protein